jgi:hypothetical protein
MHRKIDEGLRDAPGSIAEAIAALLEELGKLQAIIRKKALTGDSTAEARRQQAEVERRIDALRAAGTAEADAEQRAIAERVAETARLVGEAAVRTIADRMLLLSIPPKPEMPK